MLLDLMVSQGQAAHAWTFRLVDILIKLGWAVLILLAGLWLIARAANFSERAMGRAKFDITLRGFLRNLVYGVLLALLVVIVLQALGVPSTPLITALGTAGLAVGLSLRDSLSNLAWGVLLITFRPFRVDDYISAGGVEGAVKGISLMYTHVLLADNREVYVPNAKVGGDAIINFNRLGKRRFELVLQLAHDANMGLAMERVRQCIAADSRILQDPAAGVWTQAIGTSGIELVIRGFATPSDLWESQTALLRAIKEDFEQHKVPLAGSTPTVMVQVPAAAPAQD